MGDAYPPDRIAGAALIQDLARALADQDHSVTVLTPFVGGGDIEVLDESTRLRVVRFPTASIKTAPLPLRAWREWRLPYRAGQALRVTAGDLDPEGVIYYSPTIFWGPLVRVLKRRTGCASFLILRDIFPKWAVDSGVLRRGVAYRILRHFELVQYRAADTIGIQMERDGEYFRAELPQFVKKLVPLFNWSVVEPPASNRAFREAHGLAGSTLCLYGGNCGRAQRLENLIDVASLLADRPDLHFALIGDGSDVDSIRTKIESKRLRNIRWYGSLPQDEFAGVVADADIGLIFLDPNLQTNNFPGKLLAYMRSGIPVVAGVNEGAEILDLINDSGIGFASRADRHEELAGALSRLADDAALRQKMGRRAAALLRDRYSADAAGRTIAKRLRAQQGTRSV